MREAVYKFGRQYKGMKETRRVFIRQSVHASVRFIGMRE